MYVIYKDSKRTFIRNTFATYDAARVFIRKLLRKRDPWASKTLWNYSNPRLYDFGYSIKKV